MIRPRECAIAPAKFRPGTRVTYDFGKVSGIPRAKSRVRGLITKCSGRFLATRDFARWMYEVHLDEPFCSEVLWWLEESKLTEEKKR